MDDQVHSEAGIPLAPVLACIGRDRVILKEIKVPAVAEHEEPALVRFQALKEFADSGEEVVLDYIPLGPAGADGRRVQVISVRKDLVRTYRKLAELYDADSQWVWMTVRSIYNNPEIPTGTPEDAVGKTEPERG